MRPRSAWIATIWMLLFLNNAMASKRALIIAIGNYDRSNTGWHTISSLNDVPLIESILSNNGFTDQVTLTDELATREGILTALKKLAQRTQPGDIVLVHFSSHGQLIEDEKGGNPEESIVAWGAPTSGQPGYKGEKHLVYGDIRAMRDTLRRHAGASGDVIFFFDACHSGGLTRGRAITRGGAAPIQIAGWKPSTTRTPDRDEMNGNDDKTGKKDLAPYVAISACRSGEINSEYPDGHCGSLSYVLSRAFSHITDRGQTYSQLFASVLNDMYDINPSQHPVISGYPDRQLFAGEAVPIDPHFIIKDQKDNGNYLLNGGVVNGLTKGSILEAYPAGVKSKGESMPLFRITVAEEPDMLSCEVKIDTSIPDLKYTAYWFYIRQVAFDGTVVRLSIDSLSGSPDIRNSLTEFFKADSEILLTSGGADLLLGYEKLSGAYNIYNGASGALVHSMKADNAELKTYLGSYAQCTALKKINMSNDALSFAMELKKMDGTDIKTKKEGIISVREGDKVKVALSNTHEKPLFINIFNFSPDGTYELIKADAKLISSLSITADISKPDGIDMLLAIASAEPLYLDALSAASPSRSAPTRGSLNSLQKIFRSPATRGQMAPSDEEGFTAHLSFEIGP